MMRAQLDAIPDRGEPLAVAVGLGGDDLRPLRLRRDGLESRSRRNATVRASATTRRPSVAPRLVDEDEAALVLPPIYERVRRATPGMFARTDAWWREYRLPIRRTTGTGPVRATSPSSSSTVRRGLRALPGQGRVEGRRVDGSALDVIEAIATSPRVHGEIWRYLLDID